jgi:hypothetical protein
MCSFQGHAFNAAALPAFPPIPPRAGRTPIAASLSSWPSSDDGAEKKRKEEEGRGRKRKEEEGRGRKRKEECGRVWKRVEEEVRGSKRKEEEGRGRKRKTKR